MYNAYIPGPQPYEKIPEESPPGFDAASSSLLGSKLGGLSGLLKKFGLDRLDSGDLLLLLILFLLLREKDQWDPILLLALAFVFLSDNGR